ncbi:MAG: L,D-transpeptidase family protein [Planctomycetota bacterium]
MQPFAQNTTTRIPLYWWLTGIGAAAFTIWAMDLLPTVQSVPTGEVAGLDAATEGQVAVGADESWEDLDDPQTETSLSDAGADNDSQWSGLTEPAADDTATPVTAAPARWRPRSRPQRDAAVRPAGYTADAPESTEEAAATADASVLVNGSQSEILDADFADAFQQSRALLKSGNILDAHAELSRLYWKAPAQRRLLRPLLLQTAAEIFTSPEHHFGEPHIVEYGETLESIGRQYEVPWQYLAKLNRVTPAKLQAGRELKVVRGPFGAVVDLSEFTLTVHAHGWYIRDYRIGVGRDGKTPLGRFQVQEKLENPVWYDPDGGTVEADDPENPLGEYWIGLGNHIGIHGTIDPDSIGKAASRGCIHLGDDDIRDVFSLLGSGSEVTVRK